MIGVSSAWGGWNVVPEGSAAQAKEWWTPIPPLAGPDGNRDAEFNALSGIGNGLVITNAAEMPEALVRYVDLNYVPENGVQWSLGPLGHNLYEDDQGRIGYVPTPAEYNGYGQFRISETAVFMTLGVVPSWAASNFLPDERNEWKNHLVDVPAARHHVRHQRGQAVRRRDRRGRSVPDRHQLLHPVKRGGVGGQRQDRPGVGRHVKRLNDMGMERVREIYQVGADRWAGE